MTAEEFLGSSQSAEDFLKPDPAGQSALASGAVPVLAVARGPGTVYGLNPDGSVDRQDNGVTFAGDNSRDPNFRGVAIPRSAARQIFGSEQAAMGNMVRVTNERTGLQTTAPIREIGPGEHTGNVVDLSYALHKEVGATGRDPMTVEVLGKGGNVQPMTAEEFLKPQQNGTDGTNASDAAFLAANDPGVMQQTIPGMVQVQKALPVEHPVKMADDPKNLPASDWMQSNVWGPASLLPTVAPELLKVTTASAMKFAGQGLLGMQNMVENADSALPTGERVAPKNANWITDQAKEMRDWADKAVTDASPLATGAAEMIGNIGGFAAVAAVNPEVATAFFSAGTGEDLAQAAQRAGADPGTVTQARDVGAALGLAAAHVPVARLGKLLDGWNVNPFVKEIAQGLTVIMDKPDTTKRLIASGIEGIKSGLMGAATGAGYRVGMNAASNLYAGTDLPLTEGAAGDAAMFGIPMAAGGAAARFIEAGRGPVFTRTDPATGETKGMTFAQASDVFAKRAAAYEVKPETGNLKPEGAPAAAVPTGPAASPAANEFERMAGISRAVVPVQTGLVPVQSMGNAALPVAGDSPDYQGQNFVDRGGAGPVFQGGSNELAGRIPMAALLPPGEVVVPREVSNDTLPVEPVTISMADPGMFPTVEVPVAELHLSSDVPNFKRDADERGVVAGNELKGKYNRLGTGAVVAWERLNGRKEVITGRHRFALATSSGEKTIPTQIVREADGFSLQDALTFDAEANIRDGQGTLGDYANYFRNSQISQQAAAEGGLLSRAKGRAGFAIGKGASDDLYALFQAGKISESKAVAIAEVAPGDPETQRAGIAKASSMPADELRGYVGFVRARAGAVQPEQFDMFGNGDAALQAGEKLSKLAAQKVREIQDQITAVRSAAKRPEAARKLGVNVKDPEGIMRKIAELESRADRFKNFYLDRKTMEELAAELDGGSGDKMQESAGQYGELIPAKEIPFNLQGEVDLTPELQRAADAKRAAADARAAQEQAQGTLFEAAANMLAKSGVPTESIPEAAHEISSVLLESAAAKLAKAQQQFGQGDLFSYKPAADSPTGSGDVRGPEGADEVERLLRLGLSGEDAALAAAVRQSGSASNIIRDLIAGKIPTWDIIGTKIEGPEDVAAALMAVRSPFFESLKVAVMDKDGIVLHSEVLFVGSVSEAIADVKRILGVMLRVKAENANAHSMVWAHNHPSGDPSPSSADIRLVNTLNDAASEAGIRVMDHVITNGRKFYSFRDGTAWDLPNAKLAEWERIPMDSLRKMDAPARNAVLAAELRKGNPGTGFIMVLNTKTGLNGIDQVPGMAQMAKEDLYSRILDSIQRHGGFGVVLVGPQAAWSPSMWGLKGFSNVANFHLYDVLGFKREMNGDFVESAYKAGLMEDPVKMSREDALAEDPKQYDVGVKIDGKWVPEDLAHLDSIKPVGMPELVKLAKELTAKLPTLKKLRKYRGLAYTTEGNRDAAKIVLDPRIFADPMGAAKTLAHEIGHIGDSFDEATLNRGNVLGRLAVLRDFLGSTLPIDPTGGTKSLTPKERQQIRREAESAVGGKPAQDSEDLPAWQAEVARVYAEKIQEEMDARGLAYSGSKGYLPNVREELIALTDWWKPFLEKADKLPESYLKYRISSKELYADMVSVLMNDPAGLKQRAPTAWEMFFNHLDRKPDAKRALFELWDWMNKPEYERLAERRAGVLGMFKSGAELMARKIAAKERIWTFEGFHDGLRTFLDTKYWPIVKRERAAAALGNVPAQQHILEWFFDAHPLADNHVYLWLQGVQDRVRGPLLAAELTEENLGEFLMWDRIANERYEVTQDIGNGMHMITGEAGRATVANPQGHNPATAIEQIGHLEEELGPERFAKLRELAAKFHDEFFKLTSAMNDEGMIPPETWEMVQANKDHYAAFVPLDYVDTFVTAGIRKQMGTLKDIQNPYVSTVLKAITTIRAIELNKAKRMVVEGLRTMFPAEITEAKVVFDGKKQVPVRPKDPEQDILTVAQGGKRVSWYVPGDIVEMFDREDHSLMTQVMGPLDWVWRNVFYPTFITYNPVFQFIRNPIRDTRRTALNLPHGVGVEQAAIMRVTNAKIVRAFVEHGQISPEIGAALEARAMTPPMGTWQATTGAQDEFTAIARRFGLAPEVKGIWERNALLRPVAALAGRIKVAGEVRELVPKVGTYRILTEQLGWGPQEAAFFVRNHIGTPNYTKKGTMTRVANDIFPFTNIFLKGWQADLGLMRHGFKGNAGAGKQRKSAASWWLRWMLTSGSLRVLQAAGAAGVLGVAIKKLYDRVGDYYMSNYDVLPIGDTDGGNFDGKKTTMVILPRDPTDRILGALTYQFSKAIFETGMGKPVRPGELVPKGFSFVSSDVPGLNPAVKIAAGWSQYIQGTNPYDSFRSANVLTDQEQRAGGWPAVKTMLAWTLSQTGASQYIQYDPTSGSSLEIGVGAIPGVNGLVRVTDTGLREKLAMDKLHKEQIRDRAALAMPGTVQDLHQEYNYLSNVGAAQRSPVMEARYQTLAGWEKGIYQPFVEAAMARPDSSGKFGAMAERLSGPFLRKKK
jgi:hypothetical protein